MRSLLALCLLVCITAGSSAQQVTFTPVAQGFEFATDLQFAPGDPTPYVAGQAGLVYVAEGGGPRPTPFLDIRDRVVHVGESGLLGIAFDPQWPAEPFVYVHYVRELPTSPVTYQAVFSRFQADPVTRIADPGTENALLRITMPFDGPDRPGSAHQGGSIAFGNDGFLYLTIGEAQQGHFAQDMTSLLGKVLRVDVNGAGIPLDCGAGTGSATVPPSNPFAQGPGGDCDEVYAYGFRNPWRMSLDPPTGAFWIGDVGQAAWEEIDVLSAGANFGWPIMEGLHCTDTNPGCDQTSLTLPLWEYGRSEGSAIVGGYVYRGSSIPWLQGLYVYGDYISGRVWAFTPGASTNQQIGSRSGTLITSFGRDGAGELYVLDLGGAIVRLDAGPVATQNLPASTRDALVLDGPNPFAGSTSLRAISASAGPARVDLIDAVGRNLATLFDGALDAGVPHIVHVDAAGLAPGIYMARMTTGGGVQALRLVITR